MPMLLVKHYYGPKIISNLIEHDQILLSVMQDYQTLDIEGCTSRRLGYLEASWGAKINPDQLRHYFFGGGEGGGGGR